MLTSLIVYEKAEPKISKCALALPGGAQKVNAPSYRNL